MDFLPHSHSANRYKILKEIGRGGFAIVYKAHDTVLDRPVALKELRTGFLTDDKWIRRFQMEARAIARLDHPRIVTIHDVVRADDRLFLVMRLVDGPSLAGRITARGRLVWSETVEIITGIAEALDFAHSRQFIHRDLKPENILMDPERGPLLSDFGLAKLIGEHSMSQSGSIVGTPHYIAPEAWEGESAGPAADIYALGCIVYEMLTGEKLFAGQSPPAVMMAHFNPLILPESWPEGVPAGVTDALHDALARQPQARPATAGELAAALTALTAAKSVVQSTRPVPLPVDPKEKPVRPPVRRTNLPSQPTPFIGRTGEVTEVAALLNKPTCRLLTLLGPGGIGKTRLALQVAAGQADKFSYGVHFVPLQAVESAEFLAPAVADALKFPLAGQEAPATQLFNYLRDKQLLLLLDNFEQLLGENGQGLLPELLAAAPGVKLLVTSREVLHLQEEWLFTVEGLSVPRPADTDNVTACEAVQLFNERARRVRPDFSPEAELASVVRICRRVEGIPLAIELAAAWTKMLSVDAIAAEIERSLDILESRLRNVPDRQQSMRIIFDQTWQRLSRREQAVFKRLSVFRGGCRRRAAREIAGASLPLLSLLQDKALLRWSSDGRYHIHELLRQYAAEQLAQSAADVTQVREQHCAYYAGFLHEQNPDFRNVPQREAITAIGAELENIRAAWRWAVEHLKVAEIKQMARPLGIFCNFQGRYAEGLTAFENLADQLAALPETEETGLALADVLMAQSWLQLRFGRLDEIEAGMRQSQAIYRRLEREPPAGYITDPDIMFGFVALIRGDYPAAVAYAGQARDTATRLDHAIDQEFANYLLAQTALAQGHYEAAQAYAQQAYALGQAAADRWFTAYTLNTLGDIAMATEAYQAAQQHYEAGYAIRQDFNDPEGMAVALNHLGLIALRQQDYAKAQSLFEQSLQRYRDINDKGGLATSYKGLGEAALAHNDYATARQQLHQALQLAADIWYLPLILTTLVDGGELLGRTGQVAKAITLFGLVEQHPAASQETKARAAQLRDGFKLQLRPAALAAAIKPSKRDTLETTVRRLLAELPLLDVNAPSVEAGEAASDPNQALVEPLTARELEVLQLLAEGLSNAQIATRLTLAEGTVKYYTRQIYAKLQVRSRTQAVNVGRELGLV